MQAPRSFLVRLALLAAAAPIACTDDEDDAVPPCPVDTSAYQVPEPTRCAVDTVIGEELTVSSQAELDALAGCTRAAYHLFIAAPDLVSLAPLSSLEAVEGSLDIGRADVDDDPVPLCSLTGLESLTSVGGSLGIRGTQIENLSPLTTLGDIRGTFVLIDNPRLVDLLASGDELSVGGLHIAENPRLRSFRRFASVRGVLESVSISGNGRLQSLAGLEWIETVTSYLIVQGNHSLRDLEGLASLRSVPSISVEANDRMVDVSGLRSLVGDIEGHLAVVDNDAMISMALPASLTELGGLLVQGNENLERLDSGGLSVVAGSVEILSNPHLSAAEIDGFLARIAAGRTKVDGNEGATRLQRPCPWVDDSQCDEPPDSDFCAAGTDENDCDRIIE